jgi:hypothetical protein
MIKHDPQSIRQYDKWLLQVQFSSSNERISRYASLNKLCSMEPSIMQSLNIIKKGGIKHNASSTVIKQDRINVSH